MITKCLFLMCCCLLNNLFAGGFCLLRYILAPLHADKPFEKFKELLDGRFVEVKNELLDEVGGVLERGEVNVSKEGEEGWPGLAGDQFQEFHNFQNQRIRRSIVEVKIGIKWCFKKTWYHSLKKERFKRVNSTPFFYHPPQN